MNGGSAAFVKAGDKILCPRCHRRIGRAKHDIHAGTLIVARLFCDFDPPLENGDRMVSPCCRAAWFFLGSIFTERGWIPSEPRKTAWASPD